MTDHWPLIGGLALATFAIRMSGFLLGRRLPTHGAWASAFAALPGCLIAALVTVLLFQGGPDEWLAASVAGLIAVFSRNLPLTMAGGIAAIWLLRTMV